METPPIQSLNPSFTTPSKGPLLPERTICPKVCQVWQKHKSMIVIAALSVLAALGVEYVFYKNHKRTWEERTTFAQDQFTNFSSSAQQFLTQIYINLRNSTGY